MNKADCKKIFIENNCLHYYEFGEGDPIIVLHGNSLNSLSMKHVTNSLCLSHKIYAIDSRGHGKNQIPKEEYNYDDLTDDLFKFICKLNIINPTIIGYSDGANIALRLAKSFYNAKSLILISPNIGATSLKREIYIILLIMNWLFKRLRIIKFFNKFYLRVYLILSDNASIDQTFNNIKCNVNFIYAEHDVIIPENILKLSRAIDNCDTIIIKKTNHISILKNKKLSEYINKIVDGGHNGE